MVVWIARIAGAFLMVAVGLAVACGDGGGGPQRGDDVAEVRALVGSVDEAMHKADWAKLYAVFDEETRERCTLDHFAARAEPAREFFAGLTIEITGISVEGDTATVELMVTPSGWEGTPNTWELARQDGEWRLRWELGDGCEAANKAETPPP